MKNLKEEAINAISTLHEDAEIDDIMYKLYVIDQVDKGLDDVRTGNIVTVEELEKEITQW